jgi:GR25 family glycosyltransferase involved in LPS biosynthesis
MGHILNNIYDKVYVINLKKDFLKRNAMKDQLNRLGIEFSFFNAINGIESPNKEVYDEYKKKPLKYNGCHILETRLNKKVLGSYGSLGILKTMEKLFEDAMENNYKKILTLQDDVIFDNDFNSKIIEYLNDIPEDWKILSLGVSQHLWSKVKILEGKKYYNTPYYTDGAFAIGFDYTIYKRILNEIRKFNCNFDSGPVRNIYANYPNKCFTLYTNLVIANLSYSSTQVPRDIIKFSKIFKWNLNNFNYVDL